MGSGGDVMKIVSKRALNCSEFLWQSLLLMPIFCLMDKKWKYFVHTVFRHILKY